MKFRFLNFFLLLMAVAVPCAAQDCMIVNGQIVCAELPPGCGFVNGIYVCTGEGGYTSPTPNPTEEDALAKPAPYDAAIRDGSQWMVSWFNSWSEGEQGPMGRALNWAIQKFISWWIDIKMASLKQAWTIAKGLISDMGLFTALQSAWSGLPADALALLTFFGIPQAMNILLNAAVTKFVLRFLPTW